MIVDKIALILVIVGALNWGGVGLFGFDTVAFLFGGQALSSPGSSTRWSGWQVSGASRCCSGTRRTTPATRLTQPEPFNKKEHLTVLFFPCYFPACRRFTKSSAGVTLTVR